MDPGSVPCDQQSLDEEQQEPSREYDPMYNQIGGQIWTPRNICWAKVASQVERRRETDEHGCDHDERHTHKEPSARSRGRHTIHPRYDGEVREGDAASLTSHAVAYNYPWLRRVR